MSGASAPPEALDPLEDGAWPQQAAHLRDGFAGGLNVYRVMARHPDLLLAWERLRNHVVLDSALSLQQREIVILRTGFRWRSTYEWGQHVVRGRAAGLDDARIEQAGAAPATWAPGTEDTLLMQAVDALLTDGALPTDLLSRLSTLVGVPGVLDLMATVGMYTTLAFIVKTAGTPLEPDIAAAAARQAVLF